MATLHSSSSRRTRTLSADFSFPPTSNKSSMLFSMLPSAVQSRIPRLPSLRRSVSLYGIANKRGSRSSPGSGRSTPSDGDKALVLSRGDMIDYFSETEDERDRERTVTGSARALELEEKKSGIGWKFAGQGLSLLSLSVEESSTISSNPACGSAPFARQLYVHALGYLLRGLPSDLTTEEQLSVQSALPDSIIKPLQLEPPLISNLSPTGLRTSRQQPSLLHRTLASTIIQFFLLAQLLLPYLQTLLRAAYKYEREHRVSEKLLATGMDAVDAVGRRGINVGGVVWGLGVGEAVAWVVEGVTGGISEGVGEGLVVIGAKR